MHDCDYVCARARMCVLVGVCVLVREADRMCVCAC